jgi:hypothetical protein
MDLIRDKLAKAFNIFEKDVFILQQSGIEMDRAGWLEMRRGWKSNKISRMHSIIDTIVATINTGLGGDDPANAIKATLSVWEMACQKENLSYMPPSIMSQLCSMQIASTNVENCKLLIATNAAATWMLTCQCQGVLYHPSFLLRLFPWF